MSKKRFLSVALIFSLVMGICGYQPVISYAAFQSEIPAFVYEGYEIPGYDGDMYEVVNGNDPQFAEAEKTTTAFERYSDLDALGRCGPAYANVCQELMPTEERGSIGMVKPTGWKQAKFDVVDNGWLMARCHLVAYCLAGENANELNYRDNGV